MSRKMRINSKHLYYGDPFTDNQRARVAKQLHRYLNDRSPKLPPIAQAIAVISGHENFPRKVKKQLRQLALMDMKRKLVSYLPIFRVEEITDTGMSIETYTNRLARLEVIDRVPPAKSTKTTRII